MFASQITKTVEIPGEGTFTVRKLNRKRLAKAAQEVTRQALAMVESFGGAKVLNEIQSIGESRVREAVARDPFLSYDKTILIAEGVIGWPSEAPTAEQIDDLDPDVEERLAREVYDLSRPKTEDERKKA